ncbi:MAG TPA: NHL repeat-containing protein [Solirubrobacteraceae bacterium]
MSSRLNLRQITVSAVALACGSLLAFGAGIAQAEHNYAQSGSFSIGTEAAGLAVDQSSGTFSGYVYDAEMKNPFNISPNSRVAQFKPPFESSPIEFGSGTSFSGVAVDSTTGDVFALGTNVATNEDQVDEFDPATGTQIATIGTGTISAGDSARIWVDSSGDVFVPDNSGNVVYEFAPTGPNSNVYTSAPTTIGSGELSDPTGVAVDSTGIVYVVDSGHARVAVFSPAAVFLGALSGLSSPEGVTVDPFTNSAFESSTNNVFVVDRPGGIAQVDMFEPSAGGVPGSLRVTFGSGSLTGENVTGIAVDSSSKVYVAMGNLFPGAQALIFKPAEPPEAKTGFPGAVTATAATLSGTVIPHEAVTDWYFEFGPSQTYGEFSPALPGSETAIETPVQTTLTGLQPNKTYHYQLIASNPNGTAKGGDQTLTTLAARPSVHGQSSSSVTLTGATVTAQINPNNQDTRYFFQYGTDITYSLGSIPASPGEDIGTEFGDQSKEAKLSGLQPNTLYHYRAVAVNATGTTEGVDHTFTTLPNGPSVTTGAASGVGQSAATLTGAIDSQGAETSYYFEYSGPGTFSIVSGKAGSGSGNATVTAPVNGLSPGASYQYRLIATNAGGTTFGSYRTFMTAPPPPSGPPPVVTGGISNLTPTSATLAGTVNPNGGTTGYQFQYGTSAAYGAILPEASAGSGTEPQGAAGGLSGLTPGTTYHYRLVATNAAGTTYGADQTFTTPAAPVSVFGPPPVNTLAPTTTTKSTTSKALTRAQKLSNALKACKKRPKKQRTACVRQARKQYGPKPKAKARKR